MNIKNVSWGWLAFAFGLGFSFHVGWTAITSGPSSVADHWAVVEGYNAYVDDPANYEFDAQTGLSSTTPPPEPLISLAFLELAGEVEHLDVVLSGVPQSSLTTRYWKWFLQQRDDIVQAWGHYDPDGEDMVHLNLWFKPSAGNAMQLMLKNLEEVEAGNIVLTGAGFEDRQRDDRVVPEHPDRQRFLGEWEMEGETVCAIGAGDGGSVTIEVEDALDWRTVLNNVRWEKGVLRYDEYRYYTGSEKLSMPGNPLGGHPFSGVKMAVELSLTEEVDGLGYAVKSEVTEEPIEGELRRVVMREED